MAETESPPEKTTVNIRMTETFLEDIDGTWEEYGFNSRSEFIRYALRDSVTHPEGAGVWKDLAISEAQFDESDEISSDEMREKYGTDAE
jgi:Arc/MetJ-type ribon-helix-helix transcriptional regulator